MTDALVSTAIVAASVVSGMLGIGVAFAALPLLSLNGGDLVNELQPVALFLNAVTALFSAIAYGRAGQIDWRSAGWISLVATAMAPIGSLAAGLTGVRALWSAYLGAVLVVFAMTFVRPPALAAGRNLGAALIATAPISLFSAVLGVGPGFLLVPVMLFMGWSARTAAAINAVAVVPSSLAALAPHLPSADVDIAYYAPIVALSAAASLVGGRLASRRMPERGLRLIFAFALAGLAAYKAILLYGP